MDVNQEIPGIISWRLWRKAMKLWADEEILCQPLGKWYKSGNDLECTWPSYYGFTNDYLYVYTMDSFLLYHCNPQDPGTFDNSQYVQWTPTEKNTPVKVKTTDESVTLQGTYCYGITGDIIHRQLTTMDEYTAMLEKWEQDIINNVETLASLDKLIEFVQQGQCLIATDSSASDDMISFAWNMVDVSNKAYFCHADPAFGKESLLRAKEYGILLVLCCIHGWIEHNKIEIKMYTIVYLDNKGIIERIAKQQTYPFEYSFHMIDPDWDIIAQICNILDLMNINANFQHMKGHQDD
eukprot:3075891-Ditylum_brightwellii.AAC.1